MSNNDLRPGDDLLAEYQRNAKLQEILDLKIRGLSWRQVAKELGYSSPAGPYRLVERYLEEQRKQLGFKTQTHIDLAIAEIEALAGECWRVILGEPGKEPDAEVRLKAIEQAQRLNKAKRDLLGLDAPKRTQNEHQIDGLGAWVGKLFTGEIKPHGDLTADAATDLASKANGHTNGVHHTTDEEAIDLTGDDPPE